MRPSLLKKLKNVKTTKKQIVVIHPESGMPTPQISKVLKRDHQTVKKAADKILYKQNETKGKNLRKLLIETYDNLKG